MNVRQAVLLVSAIGLSACDSNGGGGGSPVPLPPATISMTASAWTFTTGNPPVLHPAAASVGWQFDMPVYNKTPTTGCVAENCPRVGYVTTPSSINLVGKTIVLEAEITTTGDPIFQYALNVDNVCVNPAQVQLFFQQHGVDNRWFTKFPGFQMRAGRQTFSVPVVMDRWTGVYGAQVAYWNAALASLGQIGMAFGGGCFAGHGNNIDKGSARFNVINYKAE